MYKLFLCLRYLRTRRIAYGAVVAVFLCVLMMVIVASVFTGFLNKIEVAAKGLFGDIVIEVAGEKGLGYYDEFIAELTGRYYIGDRFVVAAPGESDLKDSPATVHLRFFRRLDARRIATFAEFPRLAETLRAGVPADGLLYGLKTMGVEVSGTLKLDGDMFILSAGVPAGALAEKEDRSALTLRGVTATVGERKVDAVQAASPFILSYGFIRLSDQPQYRQSVQVAGIRLPQRAEVSDFELGLFVQRGQTRPTFAPPLDLLQRRITEDLTDLDRVRDKELSRDAKAGTMTARKLGERIDIAKKRHHHAARALVHAEKGLRTVRGMQARVYQARNRGAEEQAILARENQLASIVEQGGYQLPARRIILGLGIPALSMRTESGDTIRNMMPGHRVSLDVLPLGRPHSMDIPQTERREFSVVDDAKSGVWSIDSRIVYIPFKTLQEMNKMAWLPRDGGDPGSLARCSQIHVKARNAASRDEASLRAVSDDVRELWLAFEAEHLRPAAGRLDLEVSVQTWRQRQAEVIAPIEAQRIMAILMIGIISCVAILLILVIFYIIVMQKMRDIGVMKAIGASGGGVATIFLAYSAVIGTLGAALGTVAGYVFVWNINPIHDWVGRKIGFRLFFKESFMFDEIPNEVATSDVVWVVAVTIAASMLGAVLPAIRAARFQPVEALRYE